MANLIHFHVAALVRHLRRHDDDAAGLHPIAHGVEKALVAVARQAADAEALDHERAVMGLEIVKNAGVDAGDELEHEHAGVEPVVKLRRACGLLRDVIHDLPAAQDGRLGIVDARKGVVALRAHLACARAENDLVVKDDVHAAGAVIAGIEKGVAQVLARVGVLVEDRLLRAGDDDGLGVVLNQVRQRRRVGHRVRAVREDKAVVSVIVLAHAGRHLQPVAAVDVRAVAVHELHGVDPAQLLEFRHLGEQFLGRELRGESVGRLFGCDRAAGGDHENMLHVSLSLSSSNRATRSPVQAASPYNPRTRAQAVCGPRHRV